MWCGWRFRHAVRETGEAKPLACRRSVELGVEGGEQILACHGASIEPSGELDRLVAAERMLFCEATGSEHESLAHLDDGIAHPRRIELHHCAAQIGLREHPCAP